MSKIRIDYLLLLVKSISYGYTWRPVADWLNFAELANYISPPTKTKSTWLGYALHSTVLIWHWFSMYTAQQLVEHVETGGCSRASSCEATNESNRR